MREQEIKKRIREEWEKYAGGEKLNIHLPSHDTSCICAFGSELACLRLFKGVIMTIEEAIKHARNKSGMKLNLSGLIFKSCDLLKKATKISSTNNRCDYGASFENAKKNN